MEKATQGMTLDQMDQSGGYLEKVNFKLKTDFLLGNGKKKKIVLTDLAPELGEQELYDKMWELTDLSLLVENPEDQLVAPRKVVRVEQRITKMVDHEADGTLLYNKRMDYLDELCFEHCAYHRLSPEHLNEQQRDAISAKYWPFVLEKYPDKKKRNRITYIDGPPPQDGRKAVERYSLKVEAEFPTIDELTKGNIWKACAKLKAYYKETKDVPRFLEGVRAIQLRTEWCNKIYQLKKDWIFRKELEAIYGQKDWCEQAKTLFKPLILLMSDLIQVQLLEMLRNTQRAEGLAKVVEEADENHATMTDKLNQLKEAANNGGMNADIVTA